MADVLPGHTRHRLAVEELNDCPIDEIMSVPLDRLCQLAWPLLVPPLPSARIPSRDASEAPFVPPILHADADDAEIGRSIHGAVGAMVRFIAAQRWRGPWTCHTLRAALFQRALHCVREKTAVVPPRDATERGVDAPFVTPPVSPIAERRGEGRKLQQRRPSECCFASEETSRVVVPNCVLAYVAGQQDAAWLTERVGQMVRAAAATPQNDVQKQLLSAAAAVSVQAVRNRRCAQALLSVLREVLQRWNAAPNTTGESGMFAFCVVVPLLHITQCTVFNETDIVTVGELLANVRAPPRGIGDAELSTATFVTRYNLSLTSAMDDSGEDREEDEDEEEEEKEEHGTTMCTEHFLTTPLSRKVSVQIKHAVGCEDVRILLVPCPIGGGRGSQHSNHNPNNSPNSHSQGNDHNNHNAGESNNNSGGSDLTSPKNEASMNSECVGLNSSVLPETVCFEPVEGATHELIGGCDAVLRYCRDARSADSTILEAEVRVEMSLMVDSRWVVEFRHALSAAQRDVSDQLLHAVRPGSTPPREESFALLRNGLLPTPRGSTLPFVKTLNEMDDASLRRRVPCRQSHTRGVRAALRLVATLIGELDPEQLTWESRAWQDAARRVGLASTDLGRSPAAMELSTFAMERVTPRRLSMPQIVEGAIALLTSEVTVLELGGRLAAQVERAQRVVVALSLLLHASSSFAAEDMFRVACLLREVMLPHDGAHYLVRFQGCGERLEEEIRALVHRLLTAVFTALERAVLATDGRTQGPHRFLCDAEEFGLFALVCLSLLATPLDAQDIALVRHKIAGQLEALLPDFSDFTRSASFRVADGEERGVLNSLRALIDKDNFTKPTPAAPTAPHSTGTIERGIGTWIPIGRERILSVTTPVYDPEVMMFDSNMTSAAPYSRTVDIHLTSVPSSELVLALAAEQQTIVNPTKAMESADGFYFYPHDGVLWHGGRRFSLTPLVPTDTLTLTFALAPKSSTWVLYFFLSGVRIAEFPLPPRRLFLFSSNADSIISGGAAGLRVVSRPVPNSPVTNATTNHCHPNMNINVHGMNCGSLPTRHVISVFATLVLSYLIALCSRRLTHTRRGMCPNTGGITPLSAPSPSNRGELQAEDAWRGFVDGCCASLRQNVESLMESISRLPTLGNTLDTTARVKRTAASFVYHRFLADYITVVRAAARCASVPVEMLQTLARVVCCEAVDERERGAALTAVCAVLRDPSHGFGVAAFDPAALWECCRGLARHVTSLSYRPIFTPESTAAHWSVFSGGRRIMSRSTSTTRVAHGVTSFASQGILMDGSMGECVAFSVRLQRGHGVETLGRFYHVGVACPYPNSHEATLRHYPGERHELAHVFTITDFFPDTVLPSARSELPVHAKHWLSVDENAVFGSGDVLTVTVHTRRRCIAFERNGLSLGTLFTDLPSTVEVLFPCVELFSRDAVAVWMHLPREIGIRARLAMRGMLLHWAPELMPRLREIIVNDNDAVGLSLLGADGDELSFCYRFPPRSGERGTRVVRLIRQIRSHAEVLPDGESRSIEVCAAALESNFTASISEELPGTLLAEDLVTVAARALSFTIDGACVRPVRVFLNALRLLSEMEPEHIFSNPNIDGVSEVWRDFLEKLIELLAAPNEVPLDATRIILDAWNESTMLNDDEEMRIPIPFGQGRCTTESSGVATLSSESATNPNSIAHSNTCMEASTSHELYLLCPTCDEEWGNCTHPAPTSRCAILDAVLRRKGHSSTYTGLSGEWFLFEEGIRITLSLNGTDVTGEGEERHGVFEFNGKATPDGRITGRCVFKSAESPSLIHIFAEEWACDACTFINLPDSTRCAMCATARPGATWTCGLCSYAFNSNSNSICDTCGQMRHGAAEGNVGGGKRRAFCENCSAQREYNSFDSFDSHARCDRCDRETRWLPEDRYTGMVEATIMGEGDRMNWSVSVGRTRNLYEGLSNAGFSFDAMRRTAEAAGVGDLSRYVPPLARSASIDSDAENMTNTTVTTTTTVYTNTTAGGSPMTESRSSGAPIQQQQQQQPQQLQQQQQQSNQQERCCGTLVSALLFFSSHIVCSWAPELDPRLLTDPVVLRRIRVLDDAWLQRLETIPLECAAMALRSCLNILLAGVSNELTIRFLAAIARGLINANPPLFRQRQYLLYALSLNAILGGSSRAVRETCHSALNSVMEDAAGKPLSVQCLRDVVMATPVVAEQQRLMLHASLRDVDVSFSAKVTATSWLLQAVERMDKCQQLPALFDEQSTDVFPYIMELPDTRVNEGGALLVGQVRGSTGVQTSQGGRYYYEVVLPPNVGERGKTVMMGWGTIQHEILRGGQHVGSDFHSWGFNCQDRLHMLTGEQSIAVPRAIVGGDVVGALLDLDAMRMCWSVNGEQLMWVSITTQGKGETIYPFVSASAEPHGVIVRLGNTQFLPDEYVDFSPFTHEEALRESDVMPQSYDYYVELCDMCNDIVNCGFTMDSLLESTAWVERAQTLLPQYSLLRAEAMQELSLGKSTDADKNLSSSRRGGGEATAAAAAAATTTTAATTSNLKEAKDKKKNEGIMMEEEEVEELSSSSVQKLFKRLYPYIRHLRSLNALAVSVAKNHDIFDESPYLSTRYQRARRLLFFAARWAIVQRQIDRRLIPNNVQSHREVLIDLNRAKILVDRDLDFRTLFDASVTGQLFHQIKNADVYLDVVMFDVRLTGEVANDAGGVTRSVVTMMCDELNYRDEEDGQRGDPLLPFFKLNSHSTIVNVVPNMDFYRTHPEHQALFREVFTWLGKMLGNATLSGHLMFSLTFPRLVWKFLTFDELTIEDYFADIDDAVRGALGDDDFLLSDDFFYALPGVVRRDGSLGEAMGLTRAPHPVHPPLLTPARSLAELCVMEENPDDADAAEARRRRMEAARGLTRQFDALLLALREGIRGVIPPPSLRLVRWDDLQQRVCGVAGANAADVLSSLDMSLLTPEMRGMLTGVIAALTHRQRSNFLLFCSGQRRLPLPEKVQVACGDDPNAIPTAHTCSPISLLLQPYSSAAMLREKLEVCLQHMYEFGFA